MNIPTAEELLIEEAKKFSSPLTPEALTLLVINVANQHALNHVQSALEAAANSRCLNMYDKLWYSQSITPGTKFLDTVNITIDKDSILNSYPLTNIK